MIERNVVPQLPLDMYSNFVMYRDTKVYFLLYQETSASPSNCNEPLVLFLWFSTWEFRDRASKKTKLEEWGHHIPDLKFQSNI